MYFIFIKLFCFESRHKFYVICVFYIFIPVESIETQYIIFFIYQNKLSDTLFLISFYIYILSLQYTFLNLFMYIHVES